MRAISVGQTGPPEVLRLVELPDPLTGKGQVLIAVAAAGVILADVLLRSGAFPLPHTLPWTPGFDAAGTVVAVGDEVDPSLIGQRVIAGTGGVGGYAERTVAAVAEVFPIPDRLPTEQAVGVFQSGRTAASLLRLVRIEHGETVLIDAAAGSTGSLLVQLAPARGATVLAAARGSAKTGGLQRLGADVVVDYARDTWVDQVREATGGKGADVTFESVGGDVGRQAWLATADHGGRFVVYGTASGRGSAIGTDEIAFRGITLIRGLGQPDPDHADPAEGRRRDSLHVLAEAAEGRLVAEIGGRFPLEHTAKAHRLIETRQNTGKLVLLP
jgi:NADPH2:quinone reductase